MATYTDFYNSHLNKGYDIDGYYGWQCWDGYAEYCNWLGVPYAHCGLHGYACDVWEQRASNGILNYFNEVSVMQPGDVAVFRKVSGWTPYSHIAIFHSDIDGTYGWFFGQNQSGKYTNANGGSSFNLCKLPYSATFDTAFRPKSFSNASTSNSSTFDKSALIEEHAKATFTVDNINARVNDPNGSVCRQYNTNDTVEYHYKWVGNGHRYICWYEAENLIMVAVSESEDYNSTRWATFESIEESTTDTKPTEVTNPTDNTPTSYTDNVKMYGVDLSEHNSDVDVSQYDFAIIRATWGCCDDNSDTSQVDTKFEYWASECEKNNVPYGVYCYDYALDDDGARQEAEYLLAQIKGKNIQMGVWFDMEDADGYKAKQGVLTKDRCTSSCKTFCGVVKAQGYYVGVYCSSSWVGTYVDTDYPLWIANWGTNDGTIQSDQSSVGAMHQYTSIPLDLDASYHDVDFFKSSLNTDTSNTDNPTTDDKPKTDDSDNNDNTNDSNKNDNSNNGVDSKQANTLIKLLIKLIKKILSIFSK